MNKILFFVDIYKWLMDFIVFFTGGEVTIFFRFHNAKLSVRHNYKAFMIIFKHGKELQNYLEKETALKHSVGFVPTMGALHDGHLSLLKKCKKVSQVTVASIFVNPTQFNNTEDLKKYPRPLTNDILILEESGCDILFLPDENEIYPDEASKRKSFNLGVLETILEGEFRPGHFQGVCLVMEKFLNTVNPDFLFLGQKDFQQCLIIKRLTELINRNIEIIICPVFREKSGLAISSRNVRLNSSERETASELYQSLLFIKDNLASGNFSKLKSQVLQRLENKGFNVEYLELAKRDNLEIVTDFKKDEELIILIAAFISNVRLIDNILINP